MTRVADAIVDILQIEGVKFVATLPGDDILPIFDALQTIGAEAVEVGIWRVMDGVVEKCSDGL